VFHRKVGRWQQRVDELDYRLRVRAQTAASFRRKRLEDLTTKLRGLDLRLRIARARRRLDAAETAVTQLVQLRLTRAHGRLDPMVAHLTQLSPLKILDRGYAIVTNDSGAIVKQPADAPPPSKVDIRLAQGRMAARVLNESK
jgi:exodeoxyribonuclease VII large subunit